MYWSLNSFHVSFLNSSLKTLLLKNNFSDLDLQIYLTLQQNAFWYIQITTTCSTLLLQSFWSVCFSLFQWTSSRSCSVIFHSFINSIKYEIITLPNFFIVQMTADWVGWTKYLIIVILTLIQFVRHSIGN